MLQLSVLRNDPAFVKERLAVKHCKQLDLVDSIIALDDQRKKLQLDFDQTKNAIIKLTHHLDKVESTYNLILSEYKKRTNT